VREKRNRVFETNLGFKARKKKGRKLIKVCPMQMRDFHYMCPLHLLSSFQQYFGQRCYGQGKVREN